MFIALNVILCSCSSVRSDTGNIPLLKELGNSVTTEAINIALLTEPKQNALNDGALFVETENSVTPNSELETPNSKLETRNYFKYSFNGGCNSVCTSAEFKLSAVTNVTPVSIRFSTGLP